MGWECCVRGGHSLYSRGQCKQVPLKSNLRSVNNSPTWSMAPPLSSLGVLSWVVSSFPYHSIHPYRAGRKQKARHVQTEGGSYPTFQVIRQMNCCGIVLATNLLPVNIKSWAALSICLDMPCILLSTCCVRWDW